MLVIMTDMTNYCESLREISTIRGEIPSRKGYPGYLYSDLAEIYERSGMIKGQRRFHHPAADPDHAQRRYLPSRPRPDRLYHRGPDRVRARDARSGYLPAHCRPAVAVAADEGRHRRGMTREDHPHLASQLFAAYSYVKDVRNLASVIGEEELTPLDHQYLEFGEDFERKFVTPGRSRGPHHRADPGPRLGGASQASGGGTAPRHRRGDREVLWPIVALPRPRQISSLLRQELEFGPPGV